MTKTGNLSINTTNILPIIKQSLYADRDVFVRELLSNAYDAILKRQQLDATAPDPAIHVVINQSDKTIRISDNGIGMTATEVEKYIAQIAFSSAAEFADKYADTEKTTDKAAIIGHFGLGFYAAFMVAKTVEVNTLSHQDGAQAARWVCDGSTEYTLDTSDRDTIGTDIILHITEDSAEFLEEIRLRTAIETYLNFLPVPISLNGKVINHQKPLWIASPQATSDEQYTDFYKVLCPFQPEPLLWVHLNVDYPFKLTGILYFPKIRQDMQTGQVKLYCRTVFVSDDTRAVIPDFLNLLQGVIDCPDIPLSVSRDQLKNDPDVQKIGKHIVKKVADKLVQLAKQDAAKFESMWPDTSPFIKYGMIQEPAFYDKLNDVLLIESSTGDMTTVAAYQERNRDRLENTLVYCTDPERQASYVDICKRQSLEVLFLADLIDLHFVPFLESKLSGSRFVAVDSDELDTLVDTTGTELVDDQNQTPSDRIKAVFTPACEAAGIKTVAVKALKDASVPVLITESEQAKRIKAMQRLSNQPTDMPDDVTLVVNRSHPLIKQLAEPALGADAAEPILKQLITLAKLAQKPLSGTELTDFIQRSYDGLQQLARGTRSTL